MGSVSRGSQLFRARISSLSFECDISRLENDGKMNEGNMKSTPANRAGVNI